MTPVSFNPLLPAYRDDPYPFLHQLRTHDPVHRSPVLGVWVLTRYADVLAALKDERFSASAEHWDNYRKFFFREATGAQSPMAQAYSKWMLQLDPPHHTRLRALVNNAFTPRVVEKLTPRIRQLVDDLLDRAASNGEMDLIADLAYPLPILVIAQLLGVPQADYGKIKQWSTDLLPSFSPALSAAKVAQVSGSLLAFREYFRDLARKRAAEPQDDLISALIAAREQGDRLSGDELLATCILLAFAGHASTVQLIGGAVLALLEHPDQLGKLRDDRSLMSGAIEESLRYVSPLQLVYRTTTRPTEVNGKTIPPKQMVFLSLAGANHDPSQFSHAEKFDITRSPNRHVAFGYGIHYCAGAPLARLEGQIVLDRLLTRFHRLELAGKPTRESSLLLRGLTSLPIRLR